MREKRVNMIDREVRLCYTDLVALQCRVAESQGLRPVAVRWGRAAPLAPDGISVFVFSDEAPVC